MYFIIFVASLQLLTERELKFHFGRKLEGLKSSKPNNVIVLSCPQDTNHCMELHSNGIPIYNTEFVITGVLRQKLDYENNKIVIN